MATFTAETRTTGNARVEFQISVGNQPGMQLKEQPWLSATEIRALGSQEGRYLAGKCNLGTGDASLKFIVNKANKQGE